MVALFAQQSNIVEFPQKSNEWYTPARYVEAARTVMGGIDLDPASCKEANIVVRAGRFYTKHENGLEQEWYGRVWLNPPYSSLLSSMGMTGNRQGPTALFVAKLISEFENGKVSQAIVCVNANSVRPWFQSLWKYPICFASQYVTFNRPREKPEHHYFGTAFAYLGPQEQTFIDVFSQFGTVARRVSVPKVQPVNLSLWEVSP